MYQCGRMNQVVPVLMVPHGRVTHGLPSFSSIQVIGSTLPSVLLTNRSLFLPILSVLSPTRISVTELSLQARCRMYFRESLTPSHTQRNTNIKQLQYSQPKKKTIGGLAKSSWDFDRAQIVCVKYVHSFHSR